jgi:hypothetical protein
LTMAIVGGAFGTVLAAMGEGAQAARVQPRGGP